MTPGLIVSVAIGFGLLAAVGMLVNGMPRKNFVKSWLMSSTVLLLTLFAVTAVIGLVVTRAG